MGEVQASITMKLSLGLKLFTRYQFFKNDWLWLANHNDWLMWWNIVGPHSILIQYHAFILGYGKNMQIILDVRNFCNCQHTKVIWRWNRIWNPLWIHHGPPSPWRRHFMLIVYFRGPHHKNYIGMLNSQNTQSPNLEIGPFNDQDFGAS